MNEKLKKTKKIIVRRFCSLTNVTEIMQRVFKESSAEMVALKRPSSLHGCHSNIDFKSAHLPRALTGFNKINIFFVHIYTSTKTTHYLKEIKMLHTLIIQNVLVMRSDW